MADKMSKRAFKFQREKEEVYMVLHRNNRLFTAKEIANILCISTQKATYLLNSLVDDGEIIRGYNHNDTLYCIEYPKMNQAKENPMEYKIYLKLIDLIKKFKNYFNPPID